MSLRITVIDEQTGDTETVRIGDGDYLVVAADPCLIDGVNRWGNGTVQLTIKKHSPQPLPAQSGAQYFEGVPPELSNRDDEPASGDNAP